MKLRSFAKVNLGLEVLNKRENGYHEIKTLFQTIDLFDILEIRPTDDGKISLRGNDNSIPWDEDNLIFKAALLLKRRFHISGGLDINVTKNIPSGGGLGGGSSNAAMTLYALNKLWGLELGKKHLKALGSTLGADVPYFLEGGLCMGQGKGDEIIPLDDLDRYFCLLVIPPFSISTSSVYQRFQFALTSEAKESKISEFLKKRKFNFLENRFAEYLDFMYITSNRKIQLMQIGGKRLGRIRDKVLSAAKF